MSEFNVETNFSVSCQPFQLGTIENVSQMFPATAENYTNIDLAPDNIPAAIWRVEVGDPYVEAYPASKQAEVKFFEKAADELASQRRQSGYWRREPSTPYTDEFGNFQEKAGREWGDPLSSKAFFEEIASSALGGWRTLIPSSRALQYLSDPFSYQTVTFRDSSGLKEVEIDDTARQWMSLCTDARGIRNRATVMSQVVKQYVVEKHDADLENDAVKPRLYWLSVACGTALPTMQAAIEAEVSDKTSLQLIDIDKNALKYTRELAKVIGFEGTISQKKNNIFDPHFVQALKNEMIATDSRPDLVDLMGIFEYIGEHLKDVDPKQFVSMYYDLLKPGGKMLIGQMRADRPNADFTMGVVGWPYVVMRSPDELLELLRQSGIPMENTQLYLSDDDVYSVVAIDKPQDIPEVQIIQ